MHQIAKRIACKGHTVHVFCEKPSGLSKIETIEGVEYRRKGNRATLHIYSLWFSATRKYDIFIDDIAHAVPWMTPVLRKKVIAIVHHLHSDILVDEMGSILGRILIGLESLIPMIYGDTPFVVVSKSTKNELVAKGVSESNITVIYNGVETGGMTSEKSDVPSLIYFGRYRSYKRLKLLIDIVKKVRKYIPRVRLTIAGRGTDNPELREFIKSHGLQDTIIILGEVDEKIKSKLLSTAWLNLITSVKEGWSITTIEAARHKTPTIAFNVPGLQDSVLNGKTGILIPEGNVDLYVKKVIDLLNDSSKLQNMSEQAYIRSLNFTWDKSAEEFLKLLEEMIS